jgi:site-specific DNA-methyltransferase (adenine-specific)
MIAPYYSHDNITIYHAKCEEVLPQITDVDLVITDPPYGMNYQSNHRRHVDKFAAIANDDRYPVEVLEDLIKMARVAVYAFTRWDSLPQMPVPKSLLVWAKGGNGMGDLDHEYGRTWEAIAFYAGPQHAWRDGRPSDVIKRTKIAGMALVHPTEKPTSIMSQLILDSVGETILDPFMGAGSTLVAAKELRKTAIGIELDERYCEQAAKKLMQEVFNFVSDLPQNFKGDKP